MADYSKISAGVKNIYCAYKTINRAEMKSFRKGGQNRKEKTISERLTIVDVLNYGTAECLTLTVLILWAHKSALFHHTFTTS
jgi:hypothetical protein